MKKGYVTAAGLASGLLAGFFGAGGGIAAVPLLGKAGMDEMRRHAASVFLILGVSAAGAAAAVLRDPSVLKMCLPFLPGTVGGGIAAALLLKKTPGRVLQLLFGALMLSGAVRLAVSR